MISETLVDLSRLQFAATAMYHFIFVPLTLGMVWLLVIMETVYVMTGKTVYKDMTRFWGKLFGINFALGVTTGLTMEFQFGTNWAAFSAYAGGVIGQTLAMEGVFAFFLESTFLGLFLYAEGKLSQRAHFATAVALFLGSWMSGYFIVATNAFMQHPVGYIMKDGRPVLNDLLAVVTQKVAILTILHTLASAYVVTGFFLMGISAYLLLQKRRTDLFVRSFRTGMVMAVVFIIFVVGNDQGRTGSVCGAAWPRRCACDAARLPVRL